MTQLFTTNAPFERTNAAQPIQRTLIVTLGRLATAVYHQLPPAFGEHGALSSAVALLDLDALSTDPAEAVRDRLAKISRVGNRSDLAAGGYALDRLPELALFIIVDLTDAATGAQAAAIADTVTGLAQDGWGLDTRVTVIAPAADWAEKAARENLRALVDAMQDTAAAIIPLNHVNECGLEVESPEVFAGASAAIVEALVATPLRDVLQWSGQVPDPTLRGASLTAVGLARWTWQPEPVRETLAALWRARLIGRWLAPAEPEQVAVATQRAAAWPASRSLLPHALTAQLERSVAAYQVPAWPVPYPWQARQAIDRLRNLSAALVAGRAGAVELVLADWEEWPIEQAAALRHELAGQLDQEPVAGFDLAGRFLKELAATVFDTAGVVDHRQDQLEEQARDLISRLDEVVAEIDAILRGWPPGSPADWLGLLLRPWRWPGLAWDYWILHNLARELEQLVARQAAVEQEQIVVAAVAALYQGYETIIDQTAAHVAEAADMLNAARAAAEVPPAGIMPVDRLMGRVSPELEAAEAAAALGGLGRLVETIDEGLVRQLHELSRERFRFLIDLPAVGALEQMLADEPAVAGWWAERWAEATPLWLYDDARQPEANRGADRSWTAVCAAEVNRLQALLGLPDRPDWRWLPAHDKYRIHVLRWRTGVAI